MKQNLIYVNMYFSPNYTENFALDDIILGNIG